MRKKNKKENKVLEFLSNNFLTFLVYAIIGWIYEVLWFIVVRHKFVNRGFLYGPYLPIYGFGMLILLLLLNRVLKKKHLFTENKYVYPSILFVFLFIFITVVEYGIFRIKKLLTFLLFFWPYLFIYILITIIFITIVKKYMDKKTQKKIDLTPIIIFILIFVITTVIEYTAHIILDKGLNIILWNYSNDFLNINSRVCWDASRNFAIGGTVLLYFVQPIIEKKLDTKQPKKKYLLSGLLGIIVLIDLLITVIG